MSRIQGLYLRERRAAGPLLGAVLILHGGREQSHEMVGPYRLAVVRMRLLAWSVRRRLTRDGVSVWTLRFTLRGWNGSEMSPVSDARWALAEIKSRADGLLPVVIVGHSMGGRTAMRVADAPEVKGVVGLAPWLPAGEPVDALRGCAVHIAHGTADRTTDPRLSAAFADRARTVASEVGYERVDGDGHALLRHPRRWSRIVVQTSLQMLGTSG